MKIISKKAPFGDQSECYVFFLENENGLQATITNFGAALLSLKTPDRNGLFEDVVLGYDLLKDYQDNGYYLGVIVGQNSNRIQGGCFVIKGEKFFLEKNEGNNNLHSGANGFHSKLWGWSTKNDFLELSQNSDEAGCGFPGKVNLKLKICLTNQNELLLNYSGTIEKAATLCNPTNHTYFNLLGHQNGTIENHNVKINATHFTPLDNFSIPTGTIASVKNTPLDFTSSKPIKTALCQIENDQIKIGCGVDHNFVIYNEKPNSCAQIIKICEVFENSSGRKMDVFSNMPCVQFYTGNFLNGKRVCKGGVAYKKNAGFCLETQFAPNAINQPNFLAPIFEAGEHFDFTTIYKFSCM